MVMTVYGQEIPCQRAEKGSDFVRAYDEGGACVFEAAKIADFSGYSLMAMGLGQMLGLPVPRNFDLPYLSPSVAQLLFGGEGEGPWR